MTRGVAPAAEKCQKYQISSIDEMADAITGGNDIGFWPVNIQEKMREFRSKNETGRLIFDIAMKSYF